jgi:hypothetical protein
MAVVVRVAELVGDFSALPTGAQGELLVDFSDSSVAPAVHARTFWGLVLLLAVRDGARSLHYHPWREFGALYYIIGPAFYELLPPPATFGPVLLATARDIFAPRPSWRERLFGRGASVCTAVALEVGGAWCWWDAVLWASDWRSGVELFRIFPSLPQE